jgi:hypothetical protein
MPGAAMGGGTISVLPQSGHCTARSANCSSTSNSLPHEHVTRIAMLAPLLRCPSMCRHTYYLDEPRAIEQPDHRFPAPRRPECLECQQRWQSQDRCGDAPHKQPACGQEDRGAKGTSRKPRCKLQPGHVGQSSREPACWARISAQPHYRAGRQSDLLVRAVSAGVRFETSASPNYEERPHNKSCIGKNLSRRPGERHWRREPSTRRVV